MATPKTWTAEDVKQGRLTLTRRDEGGNVVILVQRRFEFLDAVGDPIGLEGSFETVVQWASIAQSIQDALLAIDQWTYDQILAQEEMA